MASRMGDAGKVLTVGVVRRPRFAVSRNVTIRARLRRPQLGFLPQRVHAESRQDGGTLQIIRVVGPATKAHRSRQVADRKEVLTVRYLDGTQRKHVVIKHVKHAKSQRGPNGSIESSMQRVFEIALVSCLPGRAGNEAVMCCVL